MREIKFRAWNIQNKEMNTNNRNVIGNMGSYGDTGRYEGHVVMQFTGLLDKNGKEIYEGDIVKCNPSWSGKGHEIGEIYWNKMRGGFMVKVKRPTVQGFDSLKMAGATGKEIIGNIYENPELLKAPNKN